MIPADLASRLQFIHPEQPSAPQPAAAIQRLTDALSDLVPGQRIMAEIQALLPNGAYRAVVAQRDITLALPFSAKAGDMLELEVVETEGKLTLAFVANRSSQQQESQARDPVAATLSQTGKLIGDLMSGVGDQGKQAAPAVLNGNQPLVDRFPDKAADLAPILKDTLTKSGVFYEAHQARWVAGQLPTEQLLQEPQGQHSVLLPSRTDQPTPSTDVSLPAHTDTPDTNAATLAGSRVPGTTPGHDTGSPANTSGTSNLESAQTGNRPGAAGIPGDLNALVQQQLNGLATQTYVWQGQVWPGQPMHWEISEDDGRPKSGQDEVAAQWKTRLKLQLPGLGGIEAQLGLGIAGKLSLSLTTDNESSQQTLRAAGEELAKSLQSAGLQLNSFAVTHGEISS